MVLVLPLPQAAIPLLLAGLRALALEFDWAADVLAQVEELATRSRGWLRGRPAAVRFALALAGVAASALVVAWLTGVL